METPNEVLRATIDDHVTYCEYIKKIQFWVLGVILAVGIPLTGFLTHKLYVIEAKQDLIITVHSAFESHHQETEKIASDRLIAVVNANVEREKTFNLRIERLRDDLEIIRREFYEQRNAKGR